MLEQHWNTALQRFAEENSIAYKFWLENCSYLDEGENVVKIGVASGFIKDTITRKYKKHSYQLP